LLRRPAHHRPAWGSTKIVDAGVLIAIEPGTDPATLAMVLAVVRGGRA